MQRKFIDMRFFGTYYFLNIVQGVGLDPFSYLRNLEGFWGDDLDVNFVQPFPKTSRLHDFAAFVIHGALDEELDSEFESRSAAGSSKLWVEQAMDLYGLDYQSFGQWLEATSSRMIVTATPEDASDYFTELTLSEAYEQLLERLSAEVFYHLFMNRAFLAKFNENIANIVISEMDPAYLDSEVGNYFASPGVLRRVGLPAWVKNAVFFRDRGICVLCHCNLTGTINIQTDENYDHIVPLARGGMNDVSNIQLLCETCNKTKSAGRSTTSSEYEAWY